MGLRSTVMVRDHDGVRHVTLDRAPVNALSMAEYRGLAAAFDLPDDVRLVLLLTEGPVWSAGQDLRELESLATEGLAEHVARAAQCLAAVAACPVPVVTVLDGPAVGAGALLVATCDIVLAVPEATLSFPELRRGLRMGRALLSGVLPDPVISYAFATGAPLTGAKLESLGTGSRAPARAGRDDPCQSRRCRADGAFGGRSALVEGRTSTGGTCAGLPGRGVSFSPITGVTSTGSVTHAPRFARRCLVTIAAS